MSPTAVDTLIAIKKALINSGFRGEWVSRESMAEVFARIDNYLKENGYTESQCLDQYTSMIEVIK